MKRVLFLAYFFPPVSGGGVGRSVKLAKYLPEFGYEPVVVTGGGETDSRWTPLDPSRASDLRPETTILRVPGPAPKVGGRGWRGRAERWLWVPSQFSRWWARGAEAVGGEVDGVDLVYATMAPYESAGIAARLAFAHGRPWVADLRDPWALDEMRIYPTAIHRHVARRNMCRVLSTAAAILMNTKEAAKRVRRAFPELSAVPVLTTSNGFDGADFPAVQVQRADGRFRIVHTGALHIEIGRRHERLRLMRRVLGGAAPIDIVARSHLFLLQAVDRVIADDPSLRDVIEVHLAGVLTPADRAVAEDSDARVSLHGYLPHARTAELLQSADLLFLPMHDLPAGMRATIVPGKTYEYLGARRPILAAVPEGDARDILLAAGNAHVTRPRDVVGMAAAIASEVARWRTGRPGAQPRSDVVDRFEYREVARRIAGVFDFAVGASRHVGVPTDEPVLALENPAP